MNNPDFIRYLEQRRLRPSSQALYLRCLARISTYFDASLDRLDSTQIQGYIRYLQKQGRPKRYINVEICALNHYYTCQLRQGLRKDNPAQHLRLRGVPRRRLIDLLTPTELGEVINAYQQRWPQDLFRQAALSMMVYQAATTADLTSLEARHISLAKAEISFPGTTTTAARRLPLSATQMMLLARFLNGKKPDEKPFLGAKPLTNRLGQLLRHQFPQLGPPAERIKKAHQIRASVIVHWLKTTDIRQVQYQAGHKYVSSTEVYQKQDIQTLQEALLKYHPMGKIP
ncbi:MAG: tyrosine-type recombinase/integrase [Bacteroidia bacterium]|nr:tyrosine-type recombinase/integrase [Bacteroidia bacterium]